MKIQNKLFLFLFSFSLVLVTVLVLLMQWSIGKGMVEYVISKEVETLKPVVAKFSTIYQVDNNWLSMKDNHIEFRRLIIQQLNGSDFDKSPRKPSAKNMRLNKTNHAPYLKNDKRPLHARSENNRPPHSPDRANRPPPPQPEAHYALLDKNQQLVVGSYQPSLDYVKNPIEVNNAIVGYFAVSKRSLLTQGYEIAFIEQQQYYLWFIGLFVMTLVALVTLPLAKHIVEPIKLITRGMHKLTQGDYKQSIMLNRRDELYELSRDYNELALTLAENETARKRWLADISHELRTPVAILRGELEAMIDNVRPLSHGNIVSANDEVKHLQRLIDDLNLLASTDIGGMRYRKQQENLIDLIENEQEKYTSYLADAGISLNLNYHSKIVEIYADKDRMVQLFENIINNCIKYSTATQLTISIVINNEIKSLSNNKLASNGATVNNTNIEPNIVITFEDNGIGVNPEHLPHLFEHLYRVEDSRNRQTGGSGLGLSICRHIVLAHQGEIIAQKSVLGGLAIIISLPLTSSS
ncbi:ATP-binding protein [Colwellia sp. E2M01]|uniref:ATP-binding protein n=1 Tax=Colwellia sp. E2M01 TaxID=2841561 RepID=UPI001C09A819|nr:ATP-binding protein [Colwellia sp. E2M01]MBU2871549.1 HAMP domain-containing protein [Colwellia sp. E2M01]